MDKEFTPNNLEDDVFAKNSENGDYKTLITKLKEISSTIALLEKAIFKKN